MESYVFSEKSGQNMKKANIKNFALGEGVSTGREKKKLKRTQPKGYSLQKHVKNISFKLVRSKRKCKFLILVKMVINV